MYVKTFISELDGGNLQEGEDFTWRVPDCEELVGVNCRRWLWLVISDCEELVGLLTWDDRVFFGDTIKPKTIIWW